MGRSVEHLLNIIIKKKHFAPQKFLKKEMRDEARLAYKLVDILVLYTVDTSMYCA